MNVAKGPRGTESTDAAEDKQTPSDSSASTGTQQGVLPEIDTSQIVRPELFHRAEVSGLTIPVTRLMADKPAGCWELYLRWHGDGRREQRELAPSIDLPDGGRLWVVPKSPAPSTTVAPKWARESREAWLQGVVAPNPADLFRRVCERIHHFLEFPDESAEAIVEVLALWTMFTYVYPAWPAVPYLSVGGPIESGKSTLFGVLSRMVFRPLQSSNMTAPLLFRTLHEQGGTLLLDEAERLQDATPGVGELRSILLSGYKPGSPARRLELVGDSYRPRQFDVFGPKAIACVAGLPEALASRCIPIRMFRAPPNSPKPKRRLDEDPSVWASIRDDLHVLALEHGPTWLELVRRQNVVPETLRGRDYELWQPLLALASWIDQVGGTTVTDPSVASVADVADFQGVLPTIQKHAEEIAEVTREDKMPPGVETLLWLLAKLVRGGGQGLQTPAMLLQRAKLKDPSTFVKNPWSESHVGRILKQYGIRSVKTGGGRRTYRDVTLDQLRRIEDSYGVDLGLKAATSATPATPDTASPRKGASK